MNSFVTIAGSILLVASVSLILLVQRELAPQGGLSRRGKWMLIAGLGTGILALAFKLLIIVLFVTMPESMISSWLERPEVQAIGSDWSDLSAQNPSPATRTSGYVWQALPPAPPVDRDDPLIARKIALGKQLFNDKNLSLDRSVACSSCHDLTQSGGGDGRRTSTGIAGKVGPRNAPTVWNSVYMSVLFWDGRAASLEEQAKGPLTNPLEMGMPSHAMVEQRVNENPRYPAAFRAIYGTDSAIDIDRIVEVIAGYERTLVTPDTPYDRFVRGDREALSDKQLRGMALFEETGCVLCHSGPTFSAAGSLQSGSLQTDTPYRRFPTIESPYAERFGLLVDTGRQPPGSGFGVWRVPSLRNVALTAPYFHNGSVDSLEEAVRIMASVQLNRPAPGAPDGGRQLIWSAGESTLSRVDQAPLSERQVSEIVAFLEALSSDRLRNGRE